VTGFTDNGGGWHTMEVISPNPTQIQLEYPGGSYHACNAAPDTYYDMEILYSGGAWLYKVLPHTSCNSLLFYTGSGKVSGPSIDMMESTDYNPNDFTNVKAAVYFDPTLEYYANGGWQYSESGHSYAYDNNPSTVGMHFDCNGFGGMYWLGDTLMSSVYAPPPTTGSYVEYC
jgi:hypothetical protein